MLMHTGERALESKSGLITTAAAQPTAARAYALEGSVFIAGAVVQWLRDGLGLIKSSSEVEALAASVPTPAASPSCRPSGLGAPHWDPNVRASISGMTRGTTGAHIARARRSNPIAFQSAELIGAMQADSGVTLSELRVDGGATANALLMQFQADLLGVPVVR